MVRGARASLVAVVGLSLVGLTACGSVNAGSGAADEFRDWMAGTDHVQSLELSSTNDLPWTGSLWAGVLVDPDATAEQIADVADRATSFESGATSTFTIGYTKGDYVAKFTVLPDHAAANRRMIELAAAVDESTTATEFTVDAYAVSDAGGVTVTAPDDVLAVFDQVSTLISATDVRSGNLLTVQDAAGTSSIAADRDTGAAKARAALEAIRARFPVTAAQLTDTTLDVRVDVAETPDVAALARRAAPRVTTTVQFGTVTKTEQGDYAAADALLSQVTAAAPVLSSDLTPESVRAIVADLPAMIAVYAAVGDNRQYDGVYLNLQTADGTFEVYSASGPLAPYWPVLQELSAPAWVSLLDGASITASGLDLETADLTRGQAHDLGAVASGVPAGSTVEVRPGTGIGFRVVSAASLTTDDLDTFGDPTAADRVLLAAFLSGWNAAG